ncbi:response regulator, partial [Candidatus Parcubacteria bacterium]|nr:response regulator [Candidatus Parcubacteria bacterium]
KEQGFEVFEAQDGAEGLQKIKEIKPNLVLLDLILPEKDGFEVLEEKKRDEEIKNIPVIVLSNLGQKEEIDKALALGATDYMVKANFSPNEIVEKISLILR